MTKILVADDEKEIVRLLKIYLETDGVTVLEANDGIQALEILEKNELRPVGFRMHSIVFENEFKSKKCISQNN